MAANRHPSGRPGRNTQVNKAALHFRKFTAVKLDGRRDATEEKTAANMSPHEAVKHRSMCSPGVGHRLLAEHERPIVGDRHQRTMVELAPGAQWLGIPGQSHSNIPAFVDNLLRLNIVSRQQADEIRIQSPVFGDRDQEIGSHHSITVL